MDNDQVHSVAQPAAFQQGRVFDALPDENYHRMTRVAAHLFDVPVASITLAEGAHRWSHLRNGIDQAVTDHIATVGTRTLSCDEVLVVRDIHQDDRFTANLQLDQVPDLHFYAGVVLQTQNGARRGSLHLIGEAPRTLDDAERDRLRDLAAMVVSEIELRRTKQEYRTLFEQAGDAVVIFEPEEEIILEVNGRACEMYGLERDELVGQSLKAFSQDVARGRDRIRDTMGRGSTQNFETVHFRADGTPIHIVANASVIDFGGQTAIHSIHRDVTERKRMREALQRSEAQYRALFEAAGDGIFIVQDGRFIECNSTALDMFGYRREELLGKRPHEVSPPTQPDGRSSNEKARAMVEAAMRGTPQHFAWQHRCRDGTDFDAEVTLTRFDVKDNTYVQGIVRDVTDRKRAEEALRNSQRFLDSIVEHIPNHVFVKDADELRFVRFNRAGEELLGFDREELLGKTDYDFFPKEEADFFTQKDREVLAGGELVDIPEETIHTKDKGIRILHTKKLPIFDDEGQPKYLLGISEDITERKRAEEALRKAKEEAEAATRAKGEFLATMSHEIRTPMNGVIGMASLLMDTPLSDEQRDFVETIRSSGDALLELINNILDLSKIEAGRIDLEARPFDVRQCVEEAIQLVKPSAAEKRLTLSHSMSDEVPQRVVGDVTRVRQVLINLLSNAVKFTEEGIVEVAVTARPTTEPADAVGCEVQFSVRDTGIGIPNDKKETLFEAFSQVDASTTREYGGTGLGLAICQQLTELMGGRIWVESEEGVGSTFSFTVVVEEAETMSDTSASAFSGPVSVEQNGATGPRILLVEDNTINRKVIQRLLQRLDHEVDVAMNGQEALDVLHQGHDYEVVLMDVQMPEVDGLEATRRIRSNLAADRQPWIVAVTANAMEGDRESCLEAGMDDYLSKPVTREALHQALQRWEAEAA